METREVLEVLKVVPCALLTSMNESDPGADEDKAQELHQRLRRHFAATSGQPLTVAVRGGEWNDGAIAELLPTLQAADDVVFLLFPRRGSLRVTDDDCIRCFRQISLMRQIVSDSCSVYVLLVNLAGSDRHYVPGTLYQMRSDGSRQRIVDVAI